MNFKLLKKDSYSKARAGVLFFDNFLNINTPLFMPVATKGTVKAVGQKDLKKIIKTNIILCNSYHLYLNPGLEIIYKSGGLHKFISWDNGVILTDSGGYQIYSLSNYIKTFDNGVLFKSYIDGSYHYISPEKSMEIQRFIGSNIIMSFDKCIPFYSDYNYSKESLNLTHNWLKKCLNYLNIEKEKYDYNQSFFPIVQGNIYHDLRKYSAEYIASFEADGNAIGGLSVGEPENDLYEIVDIVTDILPENKPRYLMGVGNPVNILESISLGIDMFDCVIPTRNGRNGMLFTWNGIINIKNKKWHNDFSPIDEFGTVYVDKFYNKSYLRYLFNTKEYIAKEIASIHNLGFYIDLFKKSRYHILKGDFNSWKNSVLIDLSRRL